MSDKTRTPPGEDDDKPDLAALRRRRAEGTASDLARMGIDPRSLGLDGPGERPEAPRDQSRPARGEGPEEPDDGAPRAPVVPLRPGLGDATAPLLQPGAPAQDGAQAPTVAPSGAPARGPAADEPARPLTTVEQLLAGTARTARPPHPTRRLLRQVARGMTSVDAAESADADRALVSAVRQRQSDRRVVAFVAGKGGVGCTTTAVAAGTTLAALREDRSAVVDAQQGTPALSEVHGASFALHLADLASLDPDDAVPTAASGLGLVDANPWDLAPTRRDLAAALERLGADHSFALLDAGDSPGEAAHAAIARADQVVVVSGAGGLGIAALSTALDRVGEVNPVAAARAVHVVVSQHEEPYRAVHREVVERLGERSAAVVVVPPDPYLREGHAYDPARVAPQTREAYVRLAAALAIGKAR